MKKFIKLLLVLIIPTNAFSQNLDWSNILYGPGEDVIFDITTDKQDNIYAVGYFEKEIYFNNQEAIECEGKKNIFLQKLSPEGDFIWKKIITGEDIAIGSRIKVNSKGECYILGDFTKSITIQNKQFISEGSQDILISKFTAQGEFIWARNIGGLGFEEAKDIEIDSLDNFYIIGSFSGDVNFGDNTNSNILTPKKDKKGDYFIAKYSDVNQLQWVKQFGEKDDEFNFIDLELKNNTLYLSGGFNSRNFDFDCNKGQHFLDSYTEDDGFILTMDDEANFISVSQIRTNGSIYLSSIAIDDNYNIYATGGFSSEIRIDQKKYEANLFGNAITLKMDSLGKLIWANQFTSDFSSHGQKLVLDQNNNIYLTGAFTDSTFFSSTNNEGVFLESSKTHPIPYLTIMDENGILLSVNQLGGGSSTYSNQLNITLDNHEHIILASSFQGKVDLDPHPELYYNVIANDSTDSYILKLKNDVVAIPSLVQKPISYFPNPVSSHLFIDSKEVNNKSYKIFDIFGQTIHSGKINDQSIYFGHLVKGIYFLEIQGLSILKVIKL